MRLKNLPVEIGSAKLNLYNYLDEHMIITVF